MPPTIRLVDPDGAIRDVDTEAAASALQDPRWRVASTDDELARVAEQAKERAYGGASGAVKAGAAAVARGATLGLSDLAARAIGGEDTAIALEGLRDVNPGISTGGELLGAIAPALLTGGSTAAANGAEIGAGVGARLASALPSSAVGRIGAGIARAGAEAGTLGRVGYSALGGAVEGGLYGAGQAVSELSLSSDPLTVERVAQALSSDVLFGAATGGLAGGGTKLAELGLLRAKGAIDAALAKRAAKAATTDEAIASGDLEFLDAKKLHAAREQEVATLHDAQAPERQALVDELNNYRDKTYEFDLFKQHHGIADGEIREAGGALKRADRELRKVLDNRAKLADNPQRAREILQTQEQALTTLHNWGAKELERATARVSGLSDEVRAEIVAGKVTGETGPFTPAGLDLAVEREAQRRFERITSDSKRLVHIDTVFPGAIEANQALQRRIAELGAAPTSERLAKIDAALEVLGQPKQPSLGDVAVSTLAPFAGPLGVAAVAGGRMIGKFRELAAAAGERAGKAASSFLDVAVKGAKRAGPAAPGAAATATGAARRKTSTEVLSGLRYAQDGDSSSATRARGESRLAAAYKARTAEIRSQTAYDETGIPRMRPEARAKMAAKLDPIRHVDPLLADRLETAGARRIEWLSSIMPRRPDIGGVQVGPDRWQPSDTTMRSFARSASAAEDPHGVLERAAHGQVTPEDAAAMRALHPEELAAFTAEVSSKLATLRKTLPRHRKLALYILTGVPIDAAHTPAILRVIQSMYAAEPGTEGGTQAPTAEPQFGSVRAENGTQAQQRQEPVMQ